MWKILKRGTGEGRRRLIGPILRAMKYYVVKEEANVLHTIKRRKANWIGHILHVNCLVKHVIEGEIGGKDKSDRKTGKKT